MWYIVGLGNPGSKYVMTRHNIGWQVLDSYRAAVGLPEPVASAAYSGCVSEGVRAGESVQLLYPDTFMNHSGSAVKKLVPAGAAKQLIVVYDDIDLPLGDVKVASGRGAGGHNGLASIIAKLGTKDFVRVRVGIAPKSLMNGEVKRPPGGGPLERFVLKPFGLLERRLLPGVYDTAQTAIDTIITKGVEAAMNKVN